MSNLRSATAEGATRTWTEHRVRILVHTPFQNPRLTLSRRCRGFRRFRRSRQRSASGPGCLSSTPSAAEARSSNNCSSGLADHLNAESERAGLNRLTLHTRKGDVLLWHAGLAHGGSPIIDHDRTRMSLVAHFSTQLAYPRDRRFADVDPIVEPVGDGFRYLKPDSAPRVPTPIAADTSALPIPSPAAPALARRIASRAKRSLRKIRR